VFTAAYHLKRGFCLRLRLQALPLWFAGAGEAQATHRQPVAQAERHGRLLSPHGKARNASSAGIVDHVQLADVGPGLSLSSGTSSSMATASRPRR